MVRRRRPTVDSILFKPAQAALKVLESMTTDDFGVGKDKPVREKLARALGRARRKLAKARGR